MIMAPIQDGHPGPTIPAVTIAQNILYQNLKRLGAHQPRVGLGHPLILPQQRL